MSRGQDPGSETNATKENDVKKNDKIEGQYRQGDVLIQEATLPWAMSEIEAATRDVSKFKKVPREAGRVVLAHGEVTGHAHAIEARNCSLYAEDSTRAAPDVMHALARLGGGMTGALIPDRILKASKPVELKHEEHATIALKGKDHVVRIQREYTPGELRNVAD